MYASSDDSENILNFADALSHYHISQPSLGTGSLKIHKSLHVYKKLITQIY